MKNYNIILMLGLKMMVAANLFCQPVLFEVPNKSFAYSPSQEHLPFLSTQHHDSIPLPGSARNLINQDINSILLHSSGYFLYSNAQIYRTTYYKRLSDSIIAFIAELNHGPTQMYWHLYLYNELNSATSDGTVIIDQSRIDATTDSLSNMARLIGIQGPFVMLDDLNSDGSPELLIKWIAYLQTGFISICQDYYSFDFSNLKPNLIFQLETKAITSVFSSDSCFIREIESIEEPLITVSTYTCDNDNENRELIGTAIWKCSNAIKKCNVVALHWASDNWSGKYPKSVLIGFNYTISAGRNLFD